MDYVHVDYVQVPQEQQQEERNRESIPPETPSPALQHANQPMAATGGMQIQVYPRLYFDCASFTRLEILE